jgi:microsomal dipeptidase-like Zn-dependent dipeptidase
MWTLVMAAALATEPVLVQMDWQAHPAMHLPWRFFRPGLLDATPRLSHQHQFRQTVYAPYLEDSGVRIFFAAAMAAERAKNPDQARALIDAQLSYVEDFVAANADRFAIGRSPEDVRRLLAETDKIVVLHAIEGGHHLFHEPTDAASWADKGVALVTLMHLRDDELGGAAILPNALGPSINPKGARARRRGERRGLTERGREVLVELDAAGILVDFSHMSEATVDDALAVTAAHGIAPVVTHGKLARIRDTELAFRDDQVVEIYRQGGVFALGLTGRKLTPTKGRALDGCPGTLETFRAHHDAVVDLVVSHADTIVGPDGDADDVRLSVGWSSDWNGWVSHSKPVYGVGRCRGRAPDDALAVDTRGLAHPGMLPSHWERLRREGMDLAPMLRSAERFLQLWEEARR